MKMIVGVLVLSAAVLIAGQTAAQPPAGAAPAPAGRGGGGRAPLPDFGPLMNYPASADNFRGIKVPVSAFKRSVDYYMKFYPVKLDRIANAGEVILGLPDENGGTRITLALVTCARTAAMPVSGAGVPAPLPPPALPTAVAGQAATQPCTAFQPGGGWVQFNLKDTNVLNKALNDAGFTTRLVNQGNPNGPVIFTNDPDGNTVQIFPFPVPATAAPARAGG